MTQNVQDLFELWPEPKVANIARDIGVTTEHAAGMKRRGSIPVDYWPSLVEGAKARHIDGVDYPTLVELHAQQRVAS
jgi:hypothetical protein